jgi:hypothetical protein
MKHTNDIIRMAREAGFELNMWQLSVGCEATGTHEELERFAALVIANNPPQSSMAWQEGFEAGRLAEREACAKVCDRMEQQAEGTECCKWPTPADCAAAIRARGQS